VPDESGWLPPARVMTASTLRSAARPALVMLVIGARRISRYSMNHPAALMTSSAVG
jgi:hypothetical protein